MFSFPPTQRCLERGAQPLLDTPISREIIYGGKAPVPSEGERKNIAKQSRQSHCIVITYRVSRAIKEGAINERAKEII